MKPLNKIEVAVYLPDEDAKKFLLFQQYYDTFSILLENEVFKQRNATISLYFDEFGSLQTINRNDTLFRKSKSFPTS